MDAKGHSLRVFNMKAFFVRLRKTVRFQLSLSDQEGSFSLLLKIKPAQIIIPVSLLLRRFYLFRQIQAGVLRLNLIIKKILFF